MVTLSASIGARFVPATFQLTVWASFAKYISPSAGEVILNAPPVSTTLTFIVFCATPPPPTALSRTVKPKFRSLGTEDRVSHVDRVLGFSSVRLPESTLDSLGIYLSPLPLGGSERKLAPLRFFGPKLVSVTTPSSICSHV